MKPHLLYSIARSRSTAILHASKKPRKIYEPFNHNMLVPNYEFVMAYDNSWQSQVTHEKWKHIQGWMDYRECCTKFISHSVYHLEWANDWWTQLQSQNKHEIFVVHRDFDEICWSFVLATKFGFFKSEEQPGDFGVKIDKMAFYVLGVHFRTFLRCFPSRGKIISWNHLPSEHFDKTLVQLEEQESRETKTHRIINYDECMEGIAKVKQKYHTEWQDKFANLSWAEL